MIERIFLTIDEAIERVGDRHMLCELVEFHGLRVYTRFQYVTAHSHIDDDGFMEDSLLASGSHELAVWNFHPDRKNPHLPPWESEARYTLRGWFKLDKESSMTLTGGHSVITCSPWSYKRDGEKLGSFQVETDIGTDSVRFMRADLDEFHKAHPSAAEDEKPLSTRERNNLLRTIAGLAVEANIDLLGSKTATQIAGAADRFSGPDATTVRKWVNDIRGSVLPADWKDGAAR